MMKAQAALEYLVTYGWALVAILIVVSVFFAIGVLNPESYQTGTCRGFGKIGYIDHAVDASLGEFKIILANGSGEDIADYNATVYLDTDRDGSYDAYASNTETWFGSQLKTFNITSFDFISGDRYIVETVIEFTPKDRLSQHESAICSGLAK